VAAMRDEPVNQDRSPDRPQVNPNLNKAQPMEIMANERPPFSPFPFPFLGAACCSARARRGTWVLCFDEKRLRSSVS
jgi:hypothetical protein